MNKVKKIIAHIPEPPLYHYTSPSGLIGILETKAIWATSHLHLNDGKEHEIAAQIFQEELESFDLPPQERNAFISLLREAQETNFILSFSEHDDLLSQWRAYCPAGNGYSLGFLEGNPIFNTAMQKSFNRVKCEYDPATQRERCKLLLSRFADDYLHPRQGGVTNVGESLRANFKRYNWGYEFALLIASFKHEGFSEEGEWRLVSQYPKDLAVSYRSGRFGVTPFFKLPLALATSDSKIDRIVVGPTEDPKVAEKSLRLILKTYGFEGTEIEVSKTPLRR